MGVVLACAQVRADPAENAQPCRAGCIQHGVGCVVGKKEALEEPVRWAPGFKERSWRRNYKGSEDGRLHSACAVSCAWQGLVVVLRGSRGSPWPKLHEEDVCSEAVSM